MASEFETVVVHNPTDEEFVQRFNGEPYTLGPNETRAFAQFVGYHIGKHLSTKIMEEEADKEFKDWDMKDPKNVNRKALVLSQRLAYDCPQRRIALYTIFQDVDLVQKCVMSFPFKAFVGEMDVYQKFVEQWNLDHGIVKAVPVKQDQTTLIETLMKKVNDLSEQLSRSQSTDSQSGAIENKHRGRPRKESSVETQKSAEVPKPSVQS